jgi:hypothetical protein
MIDDARNHEREGVNLIYMQSKLLQFNDITHFEVHTVVRDSDLRPLQLRRWTGSLRCVSLIRIV